MRNEAMSQRGVFSSCVESQECFYSGFLLGGYHVFELRTPFFVPSLPASSHREGGGCTLFFSGTEKVTCKLSIVHLQSNHIAHLPACLPSNFASFTSCSLTHSLHPHSSLKTLAVSYLNKNTSSDLLRNREIGGQKKKEKRERERETGCSESPWENSLVP